MSKSIPNSSTTIEDLPEPLLVHILSLLYIQDAIRTSLLSRKFRNLWHFMPSLHFDIVEFYSRFSSTNARSCMSRHLFAQLVSQILLIRPSYPLTKFVLTFEYANFEQHESYVQNWIRNVTNLSVSELILDFDNQKFDLWQEEDDETYFEGPCRFHFHLSDIGESCIKVLKLYQCYLVIPRKINPKKFVSVRSLELNFLAIEDSNICDLVAGFVSLETLKLIEIAFRTFYEPGGLRIYSATLKELCIKYCYKSDSFDSSLDFDICCPSLQKISLIKLEVGNFNIKDTALLVEACVDFLPMFQPKVYYEPWEKMLSYFTNISSLHVWDELLESNEVPAGSQQFASSIKHLELYCAYTENDLVGLAALLKLLPKLEILGLHHRGMEQDSDTEDEILQKDYWHASTVFNMPCLKKVILREYQKTKGERHFIKLFRKNGVVLEKIDLLHSSNREKDEH